MQAIGRQAALDGDLTRYYTGKPCRHGHIAERYVSCWVCVDCAALKEQNYRTHNRAKAVSATRRYRETRPGHAIYHVSMQRARRLGLFPYCANLDKIYGMYEDAALLQQETGVKIEVDHKIPYIKGGLHVYSNLQLMTKAQHRLKTTAEQKP